MNKTELVAAVAERAEISKKDSEKALKAFVDVVTEQLKAENQMMWVNKLNNIQSQAREIVCNELIYK